MSNIYTWKILSLECKTHETGQTDVVFSINWLLEATDGMHTVTQPDYTLISYNEEAFTPFESLSEEQVLGWITTTIGEDQIAEFKANLDNKLTSLRVPPSVTKNPPWFIPVGAPE